MLAIFALASFSWGELLLPFLWFSVILLTLAIESQTADLVSIWFAPGAFVAMILAFCEVDLWIQILAFIAATLVCVFVGRPRLLRPSKNVATNIDAIIGEKGVVVEKIENIAGAGQVKVRGQYWSARAVSDDDEYEPGDIVSVVAVEGVKLICQK